MKMRPEVRGERQGTMRLFKSQEEKQQIEAARRGYDDFVKSVESGEPEKVRDLAVKFKANPARVALSDKERRKRGATAFRTYAENILADDYLTIDEEMAFSEVAEALDVDQAMFESDFRDVLMRMAVARANDGRLSVIEEPHLMTKKNEVVHLETNAALLKEVALREWRSGSSGVSFRVAKGVRYHVGQTRGRSVVVGTELQVEDTGILTLSSQRAAYMGSRKTMEFPYAKLMGVEVYNDGISIRSSNRQRTPLFRLEEGMAHVVAATMNAAAQRLND
jgi:hypothetical protein